MLIESNSPRAFALPRVTEIVAPGARVAHMTQAELVLASLVVRPQVAGERVPKRRA